MSRRLLSFISEFIVVFTHIKLLLYIYEEDIKKVSSGSTNHIIFGDFFLQANSLKLEKVSPIFSIFFVRFLCPSLPCVIIDDRKNFQCVQIKS